MVENNSLVYTDSLGYYTAPENLLRAFDFIDEWQPFLGQKLSGYDPEYCLYEDCKGYDQAPTEDEMTSD